MCHPAQVASSVVCLVFIYVVDFRLAAYIWHKGQSHQPMDIELLCLLLFVQLDMKISSASWLRLEYSSVAPMPPIKALDSSIVAYLVQSLISKDVFPQFLLAHVTK